MGEEKRYTITFADIPEDEVLVIEESLIREQRRRVQNGERSWVVERLLQILWDEMRSQGVGYNPGDNALAPSEPPSEPKEETQHEPPSGDEQGYV